MGQHICTRTDCLVVSDFCSWNFYLLFSLSAKQLSYGIEVRGRVAAWWKRVSYWTNNLGGFVFYSLAKWNTDNWAQARMVQYLPSRPKQFCVPFDSPILCLHLAFGRLTKNLSILLVLPFKINKCMVFLVFNSVFLVIFHT